MKKNVFTLGFCFLILSLAMNACKSKNSTKSELNRMVISTEDNLGNSNENLTEKKWKMFEINGVELSAINMQPSIDAFITFSIEGNRVSGNGGCNIFSGTYKLGTGAELHFSEMVSTRKMCFDITVENQLNRIFQLVDNYSLQGNILSLKQEETVLARFILSE